MSEMFISISQMCTKWSFNYKFILKVTLHFAFRLKFYGKYFEELFRHLLQLQLVDKNVGQYLAKDLFLNSSI